MDTLKRFNHCRRMYCILIILIISMSVISGACNQLRVGEVTLFICFQIFCVILPGAAVMALMSIKNLRMIEKLVLTYALGYILTIIIYAAVMAVGGSVYVKIAFILTATLAGGILLYKGRKDGQTAEILSDEMADGMWIWTTLIIFFVSLIVYSLRWKAPYVAGMNYYEADFLYWAGDIVALTKKVPPINFRSLNFDYRYHYLGAMQQAAVSNAIGITAIKAAACFSYVESTVLVGLSACAIVGRMIKNRTVQVLTILLMLFSTGYEVQAGPTYIWHMYLVPMSYNIAQSLGIIVALLLLIQLRNETIDKGNFIASLLCLICCAGTKSAAGAVVICGFLLTYLYVLFSKTSKRITYITLGIMLGMFVLLAIYLWPTVRAYQVAIRVPRIYLRTSEGIAQSVYACIDWVLGYVKEIVEVNFWTFVPAVIFSGYLLIHRSIKREHMLLLSMIVIGTLGGYTVAFYGYSQMYFTLIAFPFAGVMAGCSMEEISGSMTKRSQYAAAGLMGVMVIFFTLCGNLRGRFQDFFVTGLENIDIPNAAEEGDVIFPLSHAECEAYCWIQENTDSDAFLLSDRKRTEAWDIIGIFAERYGYFYADDTAKEQGKACFEGDREMIEMYVNQGVDYIVQTKSRSPRFNCPTDIGGVVFENDEVAVYEMY